MTLTERLILVFVIACCLINFWLVLKIDTRVSLEKKRLLDSIWFGVASLHGFLAANPGDFPPDVALVLRELFAFFALDPTIVTVYPPEAAQAEQAPEAPFVPNFGPHSTRAWYLGVSDREAGHPFRLEAAVLEYFGLSKDDLTEGDRVRLRTRYSEGFHGTADRSTEGKFDA